MILALYSYHAILHNILFCFWRWLRTHFRVKKKKKPIRNSVIIHHFYDILKPLFPFEIKIKVKNFVFVTESAICVFSLDFIKLN